MMDTLKNLDESSVNKEVIDVNQKNDSIGKSTNNARKHYKNHRNQKNKNFPARKNDLAEILNQSSIEKHFNNHQINNFQNFQIGEWRQDQYQNQKQNFNNNKTNICFYFTQKGECKNKNCKYLHEVSPFKNNVITHSNDSNQHPNANNFSQNYLNPNANDFSQNLNPNAKYFSQNLNPNANDFNPNYLNDHNMYTNLQNTPARNRYKHTFSVSNRSSKYNRSFHNDKDQNFEKHRSKSYKDKFETNDIDYADTQFASNFDTMSISSSFTTKSSQTSNMKNGNPSKDNSFLPKSNNFLLTCYGPEPVNETFVLDEYVQKGRKRVMDFFYNEKIKIFKKRQSYYDHHDATLNEEILAVNEEENLLQKQEITFLKELERLKDTDVGCYDVNFIKNTYDREFQRAKQRLPTYGYRHEIIETLTKNDIIVVVGLTGSGKSTQIGQYLLEAGAGKKKIALTQPRKVACLSLSLRINEEMCTKNDNLVTYVVGKEKIEDEIESKKRHESIKASQLIIMTDRILLNEYKKDKMLTKYSVVVIDEAHERSVFSDVLLAELKKLVEIRKKANDPLKLIVMSATIDFEKFATYLNNCPVINIPGQMYPVKVYYEKMKQNYLDQAYEKLVHVIQNKGQHPGDILVFLASYDDLFLLNKKITQYLDDTARSKSYVCFNLYGRMEVEEQTKIFQTYEGKSKIIFATNVAETSLTINGIKTIIDSGRAKERIYDQNRNISILKLNLISQSSANQRKGRAGRTSPGICYRLYEEADYNQMSFITQPEIARLHLGLVLLELFSHKIKDPINYDLLDKPDKTLMLNAIQQLKDLKFVNDKYELTENGRLASDLYLEPSMARMVLEGIKLGVPYEITRIASLISVSSSLFSRSSTKDEKNLSMAEICSTDGDLISLLQMFDKFRHITSYAEKNRWCKKYHLSTAAFRQAEQTFLELWSIVKRTKIFNLTDKHNNILINKSSIIEAICAGFHSNLAYYNGRLDGLKVFKLVALNQEAYIHPNSALAVLGENDVDDKFILFTDICRTDKLYVKNITPIKIGLIEKYSSLNLNELKQCVKEKTTIEIIPTIIEHLKTNNNELLERIEEETGYVVEIRDSSIVIETSVSDKQRCLNVINNIIEFAKKRLINELYEYKIDSFSNTRIVFTNGFHIHTILMNREYLRLNLYNIDRTINEDSLKSLFEKHGTVLELRRNRNVDCRSGNYVIMSDYKEAQNAYIHFSSLLNEEKLLSLAPSVNIDSQIRFSRVPIVNVSWFLSRPTGSAIMGFKSSTDLLLASTALSNLGYLCRPDRKDPLLRLCILNATKNGGFMSDEITLEKEISHTVKPKYCFFYRGSIPNIENEEELLMETELLRSLLSPFGEIENITILPIGVNKDGKKKTQARAHVKYRDYDSVVNAIKELDGSKGKLGCGLLHLHAIYREELKIPLEVFRKFEPSIEKLTEALDNKFDCELVSKHLEDPKFESYLIIIKSKDIEKLKKGVKLVNELLKPHTIVLPYYKYDQLRKKLNKNNFQRDTQEKYNVVITKDAKLNQIKIYGRRRFELAEYLNKEIDSEGDYVTVKVNSFKAIIGNYGEVLNKLKDEFKGEIKCDFRNQTITLFSKTSELQEFSKRIKELNEKFMLKQKQPIKQTSEKNIPLCQICLYPVVNPFKLVSCDHVFCFECLKFQFLQMDIKSKVECIVDGCSKPFTMAEIKKFSGYNTKRLEEKCSFALNNYMILSKEYKYCDACNEFCKVLANEEYTCEQCEKTFCAKCNRQVHHGMNCDEFTEDTNLLDKYLKEYTKKCPKCNVSVEKNDGCNHMTCRICATHFCWICLGIFDSLKIYAHMSAAHPTENNPILLGENIILDDTSDDDDEDVTED